MSENEKYVAFTRALDRLVVITDSNLREIQYAKYYGNVRAGNLAKDREMVIKSYQTKVKDLTEEYELNSEIAEKYNYLSHKCDEMFPSVLWF